MQTSRSTLAALLLALAVPAASPAQEIPDAYHDDVLRLMEITGALETGEQMGRVTADQMISMLEATQPTLPPRVFEIIREESVAFMAGAFDGPDGMLDELVAVYAAHLSHDDVRAMIAFYETPAGRRIAEALPKITSASMQVGQEWGQRMGPQLEAALTSRLREEGFVP